METFVVAVPAEEPRKSKRQPRPKMPSWTRQYRLYPTEAQETMLLEEMRAVVSAYNAITEWYRFKGTRTLLDCYQNHSGVGRMERIARKAHRRRAAVEWKIKRLRAQDAESPDLERLTAELDTLVAEAASADADVAALLPAKDMPHPKGGLSSAEVTALRAAIPALRSVAAGIIHAANRQHTHALGSYFALLKAKKKGTLPPGMRPAPPSFRSSRDENQTYQMQVRPPRLWRRSAKAQRGLVRVGQSTHARYGEFTIPQATTSDSTTSRTLRFRLGRHGLPSAEATGPVATITRKSDGRWFVAFAEPPRRAAPGGKEPLGIDLGVSVPIALSVPRRDLASPDAQRRLIVGPMSTDRPRQSASAIEFVERDGRRIKQRRAGINKGVRLWSMPTLKPAEKARKLRLDRQISEIIHQLKARPDEEARAALLRAIATKKQQRAKLIARESDRKKDWIEQGSTRIARKSGYVAMEALLIANMTKSAAGTPEVPGTNVAAKSGLNREILKRKMGRWRERVAAKVQARGGTFVTVPPQYTSQTCSICGAVDAAHRDGRMYACAVCGAMAHADTNAANNIRARGLALMRSDGKDTHGRDMAGGVPLAPKQAPASPEPLQSRPRSHQ